jgi:hypothetical protein
MAGKNGSLAWRGVFMAFPEWSQFPIVRLDPVGADHHGEAARLRGPSLFSNSVRALPVRLAARA